MTIHDKLIDRLYDYLQICWECSNGALGDAAQAINEGRFDDLLGVREPTIDDVNREAVRVFGPSAYACDDAIDCGGFVLVWRDRGAPGMSGAGKSPSITAPTVAAAYAFLRALPDWKVEEG